MSVNEMTKEKAAALVLEDREVKLMPIVRPGGMFSDPNHDGAFMFTGTVVEFVLPFDIKHNRYPTVFKDVNEQTAFETLLGVELNPYKTGKDNYIKNLKIRIIKDDKLMKFGYTLNLSDPMDALRYRILRIVPQVAPSWAEKDSSPAYKFALVDAQEIEQTKSKKADAKKKAYMFLGKIENSQKKMLDFLRVFGERPANNATIDWLKGQIDTIIDNPAKLVKMLELIDDPNYEIKLFIEDAVDCGAITKKDRKYYLPGGDALNPADPTLNGTISILKKYKEETDTVYLNIMQQIENSK